MKANRPKPIEGENRWVDFDDESNSWGIFGADSGFCYSTWTSEIIAKQELAKWDGEQKAIKHAFDMDEWNDWEGFTE